MNRWAKGLLSLFWVVLGIICVSLVPFSWWMLFNPLEPYDTIRNTVSETIFTLFITLALPWLSMIIKTPLFHISPWVNKDSSLGNPPGVSERSLKTRTGERNNLINRPATPSSRFLNGTYLTSGLKSGPST